MSVHERIPYHVELSQIINVLARQIYQSPLALLRENCQNAYDAILMRKHFGEEFQAEITISVEPKKITISDNGIGMTKEDLVMYYWRAGSSGKNNPEARAAGVVGTFGIGAMANFGIARALTVISESSKDGQRTKCYADRETLSTSEKCIDMTTETPSGRPGTTVIAEIPEDTPVNVEEALTYIADFVRYLDIPVMVNGKLISQETFETSVAKPSGGFVESVVDAVLGPQITADVDLVIANTGEVWLGLTKIRYSDEPIGGIVLLWQGMHQIRTFRSKFALASTAVSSSYRFGGVANLAVLEPTAGREAITTSSLQLLQTIVTASDAYVSERIAETPLSNLNTSFMDWVAKHNRYELCSNLEIRVEPDNRSLSLSEVRDRSKASPLNYFDGSDKAMIETFATDEKPLVVVSSSQPRRRCELAFLSSQCQMNRIVDAPTVLSTKDERDLTLAESAFALRLISILETDYFVKVKVDYGKMSHGLPVYVELSKKPIEIVLDSSGSNVAMIFNLYHEDIESFSGMAKDFIRNIIFPKIANAVPSSTRQGAEAFLRAIRQPRDIFEYEKSDLSSLSEIWERYLEGEITLTVAARQSATIVQTSVQSFDRSSTANAVNVIPDVLDNQRVLEEVEETDGAEELDALPAITRLDKESSAKLLTIGDDEPALKGHRCFIAITDRARRYRGEFFLQPHRTEIVWGGQKVLYIFQHHSGKFGLYYELQGTEVLSDTPGGHAFPTSTIMLKNQIYIPVPDDISQKFVPTGIERKRFEVRFELLYPEPEIGAFEDNAQE